jgi:hypothetical protein
MHCVIPFVKAYMVLQFVTAGLAEEYFIRIMMHLCYC